MQLYRPPFCFLLYLLLSGCSSPPAQDPAPTTQVAEFISEFKAIQHEQDPARDSLLRMKLENISSYTYRDQATIYSKLSYNLVATEDSSLFRTVNRNALAALEEVQDSTALAEAHWDLAQFFYEKEVMDSAYTHYYTAHNLFDSQDLSFQKARMLLNMAIIQGKMRDYTGSEVTTFQAIELLKPLQKSRQLFYAYLNLGSITKELGEYDRAIQYYERAREYLQDIEGNPILFQSLDNNIGMVYLEQGDFIAAEEYFTRILSDNSLSTLAPALHAKVLGNLGYTKWQQDGILEGEEFLRKAASLQDSLEEHEALARTLYNLAHLHLARQDSSQALEEVHRAHQLSLATDNHKRRLESLKLLAILEPQNSVRYNEEYLSLMDSLITAERNNRDKFARIRFETEEYIERNLLLENQRQFWILVAGIALLFAFLLYLVISLRARAQKYKAEQEQQKANEEIFNLMLGQNQKLEEGKQTEQKRISEELHDGVLGAMNGIRMVLLGLNGKVDEKAVAMRAEALEKLKEVQEEIRGISHELHASSYQKISNFVHSLEELLRDSSKASGFVYNFRYDEDMDWDGLKGKVKINLYRCIQEGIQNSVKHGQAQAITLEMEGDSQEICLLLSDDGKGFRPGKSRKGIGLKNIEARMQRLNGSWSVRSTPGKGTAITLRVPLLEQVEKGVHKVPTQN